MGNRNMNPLQNNMLNINGDGEQNLIPVEDQNQIVQDRATTKKILAARLPVYLKKNTLSLQQDKETQDKWYIKFNYDSLVKLDCYINFNVSQKSNNLNNHDKKKHNLAYSPSFFFSNKGMVIKDLPSGENLEFQNKDAYIDIHNYLNNKVESPSNYDLSIEFVPIFPPGSPELADNNEIIFVSLCNLEKHKDNNSYEIKCKLQRLRTHGIWIDLHDIFDSSLEGLCIICCSVVRNTIFLPCKHAACCDHCGSEIKLRFKPCPICKTPIDDLLIIDSDEKKYEGDDVIIDIDENFKEEEKKDDNIEENIINNQKNNQIINTRINDNENININIIDNNENLINNNINNKEDDGIF